MSGVDVLAVMDDDRLAIGLAIDHSATEAGVESWDAHLDKHDEARAAVADLIEKAKKLHIVTAGLSPDIDANERAAMFAALARVTGGSDGR